MAMVMPQTPKAQTNVASAQKTANNETAQKPVTFNTASNSTNNVQEKKQLQLFNHKQLKLQIMKQL